jgi:hypothetical protein
MKKRFNSFEEIDAHLRILELQRKIDGEYVKLELHSIKDQLLPRNLIRSVENTFQGIVISLLLGKIFKRK